MYESKFVPQMSAGLRLCRGTSNRRAVTGRRDGAGAGADIVEAQDTQTAARGKKASLRQGTDGVVANASPKGRTANTNGPNQGRIN